MAIPEITRTLEIQNRIIQLNGQINAVSDLDYANAVKLKGLPDRESLIAEGMSLYQKCVSALKNYNDVEGSAFGGTIGYAGSFWHGLTVEDLNADLMPFETKAAALFNSAAGAMSVIGIDDSLGWNDPAVAYTKSLNKSAKEAMSLFTKIVLVSLALIIVYKYT